MFTDIQPVKSRKGASKVMNEYAIAIGGTLYAETPKAVFAALLVSYLKRDGVSFDELPPAIVKEWEVLHDNGIVPQEPPKLKEAK